MYKPFTYLIGWRKLDIWYYGVRYAKGCSPSDLWTIYFTSSKYVSAARMVHGEPDVIRIARTFTDRENACKHELKFLTRMNVPGNPRFLNRARNDSYHAVHTGMTGMQHSEQTKDRMRQITSEAWANGTRNISYLSSDEWRKKLSDASKGKPKSSDHAIKLRISAKKASDAAAIVNSGKKRPMHSQFLKEKSHDSTIYTFTNIITGEIFTGTRYDMFSSHPELKPQGFNDVKSGRQRQSAGWTLC